MRCVLSYLIPTLLVFSSPMGRAEAHNVDFSVSVGETGLRNFYLAVSNYYRVPYREVVIVRDRYGLPYDEIPVVFFLAERAHVAPVTIIDLRRHGRTWWDIAFHFGLSPEIFLVPGGPPYGKAYGYYKFKPKKAKTLVLSDGDVVDLVNIRILSEHHGSSPNALMKMRGQGKSFSAIHAEAGKGKVKLHGKGKNGHGNQKRRRNRIRDAM